MKSKLIAATLIILSFFMQCAYARTAPLVNHDNLTILTGSGKPLTKQEFKQAISVAGAAKTWTVQEQADGSFLATLVVRNKHTVATRIVYSSETYSITYVDSINMNFGQAQGVTVIHPNYNSWVSNLIQEINTEFRRR